MPIPYQELTVYRTIKDLGPDLASRYPYEIEVR